MPRPASDVRHDTAILCLFLYKNKKQTIGITHIVQCQWRDILKWKQARKRSHYGRRCHDGWRDGPRLDGCVCESTFTVEFATSLGLISNRSQPAVKEALPSRNKVFRSQLHSVCVVSGRMNNHVKLCLGTLLHRSETNQPYHCIAHRRV